MKTKTKTKAPIIRALNYSPETVAEVKRIQSYDPVTRRRDKIRDLLQGPMCTICAQVPDFRIEFKLDSILKIECYCNNCFTNIYLKNEGIDIDQIAEAFNCTIAEPGSGAMAKIKVEGYNDTKPKSSNNNTIIKCRKCHMEEIMFPGVKGPKGNLIPFSVKDGLPHECQFSDWWECFGCQERLYFDNDIRSGSGKRIPLNYYTSDPHICSKKDLVQ